GAGGGVRAGPRPGSPGGGSGAGWAVTSAGWVMVSVLGSALEQLGFLVAQQLVDLRGVLVRGLLPLPLGPAYVVLAGVAVVGELLERGHRVATDVPDRDARVLRLVLGHLDV